MSYYDHNDRDRRDLEGPEAWDIDEAVALDDRVAEAINIAMENGFRDVETMDDHKLADHLEAFSKDIANVPRSELISSIRLVRAARRALLPDPFLVFLFMLALVTASSVLAAPPKRSATTGCRVTGTVISTRAETRADPAENQFRIRVLDSPWGWQIGSSMPVTSAEPVNFSTGDTVEVDCDYVKVTRHGRFFGLARRLATPPSLPAPGVPVS